MNNIVTQLRCPEGLHAEIVQSARQHRRSMNAEILYRAEAFARLVAAVGGELEAARLLGEAA